MRRPFRVLPRWKRTVDVVCSSLALVLLSPIFLVISLAIWFTMGRPLVFRQVRPGWRDIPFTLFKFRTMRESETNFGNDKARLTFLGEFLRRFSLDELPQLWNVLNGDMSLVGPRPLLVEYLQIYTDEQARRNEVPPGVTGWSQINGRNALDWEQRLKMDVWYVDNMSLWLDFKVLVLTIIKAFTGQETCPATLLPGSEHLFDSKGIPLDRRAA